MTTKKKPTGLASFANPKLKPSQAPTAPAETTEGQGSTSVRTRGKGQKVVITLRFTRKQWETVHEFALSEGTSIQQLGIRGLSRLLQEKGLPAL